MKLPSLVTIAILPLLSCSVPQRQNVAGTATPSSLLAADAYQEDALVQFRTGSLYPVPPGHGPGFLPSLDFPQQVPQEQYPWDAVDFRIQPERYLAAVLEYVVEGNVEVDWNVGNNRVRRWYHAPWMHAGQRGREPIHGLTLERRSRPRELHPHQTSTGNNWAVGFYNAAGGYTLGQVWADPTKPNSANVRFPIGTVSAKLLFTDLPIDQVPYLRGAKVWQADINRNGSPVEMRLLQVDFAIRDARADSTTGWVFGTFIYNGDKAGATVWDRLEPVGLHWGNDPGRRAQDFAESRPLREGWLNPRVAQMFAPLPRKWLGLWGRVNGPVDNPSTTCAACHGRAMELGYREVSVPFEPDLKDQNSIRQYFANRKPSEPFFAGYRSLDYSLQLSDGIANFRQWVEAAHPAHRDYVYGEAAEQLTPYASVVRKSLSRAEQEQVLRGLKTRFVRGEAE